MEHLRIDDLWCECYESNLRGNRHVSFSEFPKACSWELDNRSFKLTQPLERVVEPQTIDDRGPLNTFLQSWLFFGLIKAVVYDDSQAFDPHRFATSNSVYLSTEYLGKALDDWLETEASQNRRGKHVQHMRMIRAQEALNLARKVIKSNCSYENLKDVDGKQRLPVDDELAATLMVLGETLSHAMNKIVVRVGAPIRGWHSDDDMLEGWGTPRLVIRKMKEAGWCRQRRYTLLCQLRHNATSLISIFDLLLKPLSSPEQPDANLHKDCRPEECVAHKGKIEYDPIHHPDCEKNLCDIMPIKAEKLARIIQNDEIPILQYIPGTDTTFEIDVLAFEPPMAYATVSHVWSDGYGNPTENSMQRCQLAHLKKKLEHIRGQIGDSITDKASKQNLYFWIDTLAIPVQKRYREQRTKIIGRIYDIFNLAKYTIVIDNELGGTVRGISFEQTALKILVSGWMRRLWTLQEAYLSRRMYFVFKETKAVDLDDIWDHTSGVKLGLLSNIADTAKTLHHNLLGQNRVSRIHEIDSSVSRELLTSVWRATQWRTTTHKEHETLALATLLGLDYGGRSLESGSLLFGLTDDIAVATVNKGLPQTDDAELQGRTRLDDMMRDFLELIHSVARGAIPPGIIFLPGPRVRILGYRWAPRSWMVHDHSGNVDPMRGMTSFFGPASISPDKGLEVCFPGFLLHTGDNDDILKSIPGKDGSWREFTFPTDRTLLDWFHVKQDDGSAGNVGARSSGKEYQLALIMSRGRPSQTPEVGLLVEIHRTIISARNGTPSRNTYVVKIICRAFVNRETDHDKVMKARADISGFRGDNTIIGEVLNDDQEWLIDPTNLDLGVARKQTISPPSVPVPNPDTALDLPFISRSSTPQASYRKSDSASPAPASLRRAENRARMQRSSTGVDQSDIESRRAVGIGARSIPPESHVSAGGSEPRFKGPERRQTWADPFLKKFGLNRRDR